MTVYILEKCVTELRPFPRNNSSNGVFTFFKPVQAMKSVDESHTKNLPNYMNTIMLMCSVIPNRRFMVAG